MASWTTFSIICGDGKYTIEHDNDGVEDSDQPEDYASLTDKDIWLVQSENILIAVFPGISDVLAHHGRRKVGFNLHVWIRNAR